MRDTNDFFSYSSWLFSSTGTRALSFVPEVDVLRHFNTETFAFSLLEAERWQGGIGTVERVMRRRG